MQILDYVERLDPHGYSVPLAFAVLLAPWILSIAGVMAIRRARRTREYARWYPIYVVAAASWTLPPFLWLSVAVFKTALR